MKKLIFYLKKPLIKIYHFLINFFWRIIIKHHNVVPINRLHFPYKKIKINYQLKSRKVNNSSLIEIYKIINLYKPSKHYVFFSLRYKSFFSENWIYDLATRIKRKRQNINITPNPKKIELKKPVFFLTFTEVYSYFIFWNIFNILLLIKNKIPFVLAIHEDQKKMPSFNIDFINFLKKYLNLEIINFNDKDNLLIKSETIMINNYQKKGIYDLNKTNADFPIFPREIINDLPHLIIKNKKLKKFFGKPRNDIILISREDSRIMRNEKALLNKIPVIKRIVPEKLSIEEEISFAYHAKVIISPFGAAISNIFFARPECTLIRLKFNKKNNLDSKEDLFSDYTKFEMIAETKGMNYYIQNHGDFYGISNQKDSYFYADIKKIDKLLKRII